MMFKSAIALVVVVLACVLSASADQTPDYRGPAGTSPTGPPQSGFALSIEPDSAAYFLGTPMWITVEVRNVSGRDQGGELSSLHSDFEFLIKNSVTGAVVAYNRDNVFGIGHGSYFRGGLPIPKNTSMYARLPLGLLYSFKWPGLYAVQVVKGRPMIHDKPLALKSNIITITVLP
jgi:hypothetical protein